MPKKKSSDAILRSEQIAPLVRLIRGEKVLLDTDLADLYGVETKALNQAIKRNSARFPDDFMFQLTSDEWVNLKSQIVTSSSRHGGRRTRPYVFTEQGVAMLSSVLRSARAVEVNIAIMRTFVQLRHLMDGNKELARKIKGLEKKYDEQFDVVFKAIQALIEEDESAKLDPNVVWGFRLKIKQQNIALGKRKFPDPKSLILNS